MKRSCWAAAVVFGFLLNNAVAQEVREWTDAEGRKVRAALTGFHDEGTVLLRLENGSTVPYPLDKLSAADATYAREQRGRSEETVQIDWKNPKQSPDFSIRGVKRTNAPGYVAVKSGWELRIKCVEAKLEYKGSEGGSAATVRAYYYDRAGKLIDRFDKPPRRQDESRKYVTAPEFFPKGEAVEVYYPISDFHESSGLSTVLITFGKDEDFSVESMPKTSLELLAFDEKPHLFPDWVPPTDGEDAAEGGNPARGSVEGELEIRRLREETHRYSMVFDGDYRNGMPCLIAEVRAKGKISPGRGVARLYAFDDSGRRTAFRQVPSTADIGGRKYVKIPQIADESWHPVFFAMDGDLKAKHPTYLIVFQFGGKTTAAVKSSVGATVESLDFPEKEAMTK